MAKKTHNAVAKVALPATCDVLPSIYSIPFMIIEVCSDHLPILDISQDN